MNNQSPLHEARRLALSGNIELAQQILEELIEQVRTSKDNNTLNRALSDLGNVEMLNGNRERAFSLYSESIAIARASNDLPSLAMGLCNLSNIYRRQGYKEEAIQELTEALDIFQRIGRAHGVSTVLGNMAVIHAEYSESQTALSLLETAIESDRKTGSLLLEATHLLDYSAVLLDLDRNHAASQAISDAKHIAITQEYINEELLALVQLSQLALKSSHLECAEMYAREAYERAKTIGLPVVIERALSRLGYILKEQGRFFEAVSTLEEALFLHEKEESIFHQIQTLSWLAETEFLSGNYETSLQRMQQTLSQAHSIRLRNMEANILFQLGMWYEWHGEPLVAVDNYRLAVALASEIQDVCTTRRALSRLTILLSEFDSKSAEYVFDELTKHYQEHTESDTLLPLYLAQGARSKKNGNLDEMIEIYRHAVVVFEKLEISPCNLAALELHKLATSIHMTGLPWEQIALPSNWINGKT